MIFDGDLKIAVSIVEEMKAFQCLDYIHGEFRITTKDGIFVCRYYRPCLASKFQFGYDLP